MRPMASIDGARPAPAAADPDLVTGHPVRRPPARQTGAEREGGVEVAGYVGGGADDVDDRHSPLVADAGGDAAVLVHGLEAEQVDRRAVGGGGAVAVEAADRVVEVEELVDGDGAAVHGVEAVLDADVVDRAVGVAGRGVGAERDDVEVLEGAAEPCRVRVGGVDLVGRYPGVAGRGVEHGAEVTLERATGRGGVVAGDRPLLAFVERPAGRGGEVAGEEQAVGDLVGGGGEVGVGVDGGDAVEELRVVLHHEVGHGAAGPAAVADGELHLAEQLDDPLGRHHHGLAGDDVLALDGAGGEARGDDGVPREQQGGLDGRCSGEALAVAGAASVGEADHEAAVPGRVEVGVGGAGRAVEDGERVGRAVDDALLDADERGDVLAVDGRGRCAVGRASGWVVLHDPVVAEHGPPGDLGRGGAGPVVGGGSQAGGLGRARGEGALEAGDHRSLARPGAEAQGRRVGPGGGGQRVGALDQAVDHALDGAVLVALDGGERVGDVAPVDLDAQRHLAAAATGRDAHPGLVAGHPVGLARQHLDADAVGDLGGRFVGIGGGRAALRVGGRRRGRRGRVVATVVAATARRGDQRDGEQQDAEGAAAHPPLVLHGPPPADLRACGLRCAHRHPCRRKGLAPSPVECGP